MDKPTMRQPNVGTEEQNRPSGRQHQEALLDQALAETFPASDPISLAALHRLEAPRS